MEEAINLKELIQIIKKRMTIIISSMLAFLILGAFITFFVITPQYQASTQILVNQAQNENQEFTSTDIESSRDLINTYNVIITSPAILEPAVENSNFEGSVGELRSKISVSSEEESQVATITIEDTDPQRATNLANEVAGTFEQQIPGIMDVDNVSILSEAQLSDSESPVSPQPLLNLALALIVGLLVGVGIAFLLEFLDKSIKTEQDVEKELELPILGVVPTMKESEFEKSSNQRNSNKSMRSTNREERKTT